MPKSIRSLTYGPIDSKVAKLCLWIGLLLIDQGGGNRYSQ